MAIDPADLRPDTRIRGLAGAGAATVLRVDPIGEDTFEVTWRSDDGRTGQRILFADDLAGLALFLFPDVFGLAICNDRRWPETFRVPTLRRLEAQARDLARSGEDTKWRRLSEILDEPMLRDPRGGVRKLVIFAEPRDTLDCLAERIRDRLGRPEGVAVVHGGLAREQRKAAIEAFRNDPGVRVLVANDACGEGVNLQNAHLMINYDLPWNPNRIEQRFGRIHRIGQREVCHLWNLVAHETREGQVYERLLEKLDAAREARHRDTVMVGRSRLQHAAPVTLGYEMAAWLAALLRQRARLRELRSRRAYPAANRRQHKGASRLRVPRHRRHLPAPDLRLVVLRRPGRTGPARRTSASGRGRLSGSEFRASSFGAVSRCRAAFVASSRRSSTPSTRSAAPRGRSSGWWSRFPRRSGMPRTRSRSSSSHASAKRPST
jgi:superfamily II DNA/RNA helicase